MQSVIDGRPPVLTARHTTDVSCIQSFCEHGRCYLRLRPATLAAYVCDITSLSTWLQANRPGLALGGVGHEDLRGFLQGLGNLSNATVARRINGLRAFYRYLAETGGITEDPTLRIRAPRVSKGIVSYVTDNDLRRMLATCRDVQERAILGTLAHAGLRRGELVALTVDDVDLDERRLTIREGKGGKSRVVPIVEELATVLNSYLMLRPAGCPQALFLNRVGKQLPQTSLQRAFQRWVRDAGLQARGYSLHSLRHGAATRWLRAGLNIRDVQVLLGHESIETTARYLHSDLDLVATELQSKVPAISGPPAPSPAEGLTEDVRAGLALLGRLAQLGNTPNLAAIHAPDRDGIGEAGR
ncbi:MAG: tyrosine-type recombinase/integrase [Armatimonadetes bacterium]|nr:tyrosine-type recombinase/integrase [Armatimonadota bacterium]